MDERLLIKILIGRLPVILIYPPGFLIITIGAMLASALAAIAPFKVIFFGEHDKSLRAPIKIIGFEGWFVLKIIQLIYAELLLIQRQGMVRQAHQPLSLHRFHLFRYLVKYFPFVCGNVPALSFAKLYQD